MTGFIYSNRSRLKKWHFLDLICSVHVVTIITGLSNTNRSRLKKWHFLNIICSVSLVTITFGVSCSNRSCLKKWHYLDLVCSVYVVNMTTGLSYINRSCLKKWHFQPRFAWSGGVHNKSHLLKKWHYLDLKCLVKVVTITTGFSCRVIPCQNKEKKVNVKKLHFYEEIWKNIWYLINIEKLYLLFILVSLDLTINNKCSR